MKTQTIKSIIQAFECASDDTTRMALEHVLLTPKEIVATDGHKLSVSKHSEPNYVKDYLVTKNNMKLLKVLLKYAGKYVEELETIFSDDKITVRSLDKTISVEIKTADALQIKYPNWKAITPDYEKTLRISFNAEYLLQLAKAIKTDEGIKIPNVTLTFKPSYTVNADKSKTLEGIDSLSPCIVERDGNMGVLMLCRM